MIRLTKYKKALGTQIRDVKRARRVTGARGSAGGQVTEEERNGERGRERGGYKSRRVSEWGRRSHGVPAP